MMNPRLLLRRLWRDRKGYVLITTAVFILPALGVAGLVVDLSRQQNMHTSLQGIVDAAALAGARELDGRPDSIARAETEINNYLGSVARFREITNGSPVITFFSGETCNQPNPESRAAACVRVQSETNTLGATFASVLNIAQLDAVAVAMAESRFVACDVPPLMICNPAESGLPDIADSLQEGRQFILKQQGGSGGGQYAPGNFGLLDPPGQTT